MPGDSKPSGTRATTAILEISQAIVGPVGLQELLERVVRTLAELASADACSIWLIDADRKVRIKAATGYQQRLLPTCPDYVAALNAGKLDDYTKGAKLPIPAEYELGEGMTGTVAMNGEAVRTTGQIEHRKAHPQWRGKYDRVQWPHGGGECVSYVAIPLKFTDPLSRDQRVIGVLKIENKRDPDGTLARAFTAEDEEVMTILANVIAVTIENQRLAEERRKEDRKQAEDVWRLVSARLAHKIGNENFAAKGFLDDLKGWVAPEAAKLLNSLRQCYDAIDLITGEAKRFSSEPKMNRRLCRFAEAVEAAVRGYPNTAWGAELQFEHEDSKRFKDEELLRVELDEGQIRHVLMELLENSQSFKPRDARITVRTGRASRELTAGFRLQGENAFIDYLDNGPGVKDNMKEEIFKPFVSTRQGSGLGLSIVRQIVEAHGGKIAERGEAGTGARFLILFPLT